MGKLISKKAIMVGNCDGFVGNRMIAPYAGEAKMVLEEGRIGERAPVVEFSSNPLPMARAVREPLTPYTHMHIYTWYPRTYAYSFNGSLTHVLAHRLACSLTYIHSSPADSFVRQSCLPSACVRGMIQLWLAFLH